MTYEEKLKEESGLEILPNYKFYEDEVIRKFSRGEYDFVANNYRFIKISEIDEIMARELLEDEERLINIPSWLIAELVFDTSKNQAIIDAIDEARKSKAKKLLYQLLKDVIDDVVDELVRLYGYTYQFGSYDETVFHVDEYYVFRVED